jgi:hypothetical protein
MLMEIHFGLMNVKLFTKIICVTLATKLSKLTYNGSRLYEVGDFGGQNFN